MNNRYETVFILTPVLSEDQAKETVKKFTGYLSGSGAKIVHEENWGLKKLAYPIQKKSTGFYYLVEFEADASIVKPLETEFIRDERVMRFLTVKMDKNHIQFAESRRNKSNKKAVESAS